MSPIKTRQVRREYAPGESLERKMKKENPEKYFEYLIEIVRITIYHNATKVLKNHDSDFDLIHMVANNISDLTIDHFKELKIRKEIK